MEFHGYLAWLEEEDLTYKQLPRKLRLNVGVFGCCNVYLFKVESIWLPKKILSLFQNLLPTTTPQEAQQWLHRNRFSTFTRLFTNFSG